MKTENDIPKNDTTSHRPFRRALTTGIAATLILVLFAGCMHDGPQKKSPFTFATVLDEDETPDGFYECESKDIDTDQDIDEEDAEEMWGDLPDPAYMGFQTLAPGPQDPCETYDLYVILMEMKFDSPSDHEEWRACVEATWDTAGEDEFDQCAGMQGLWDDERIFILYAAPTDPDDPDWEALQQATESTGDALMAKYPGLEANLEPHPYYG